MLRVPGDLPLVLLHHLLVEGMLYPRLSPDVRADAISVVGVRGITGVALRLIVYSTFAALLWLKFRSTPSTQARVLAGLLSLGLGIFNYYCVKYLLDRWKFPRHLPRDLFARAVPLVVLIIGVVGFAVCDIQYILWATGFSSGGLFEDDSGGPIFISGFLGTMFMWAGAYEIGIRGQTIDYLSFFGGYRTMNQDKISMARIRSGWYTYTDRFRPTIRLEIFAIDSKKVPPIIINLTVFQKKYLQRVFDWLDSKLSY